MPLHLNSSQPEEAEEREKGICLPSHATQKRQHHLCSQIVGHTSLRGRVSGVDFTSVWLKIPLPCAKGSTAIHGQVKFWPHLPFQFGFSIYNVFPLPRPHLFLLLIGLIKLSYLNLPYQVRSDTFCTLVSVAQLGGHRPAN